MRASRLEALLVSALCTVTVFAADGAALLADRLDPSLYELIAVDLGHGPELFYVAEPAALESPAWRDASDWADKDGVVPAPQGGYTLTHRVLVLAEQPGPLFNALLTHAHAAWAPLVDAPGHWVVAAQSVADAVDMADQLRAMPGIQEAYVDIEAPRALRAPSDPGYPNQWHLNNSTMAIADINAVPAWNAGYTGAGVTVGILEGGWQTNHPDLAGNYNATASQSGGSATSHGTSCAGVAAAIANNGAGGAGLAYAARISQQIYGSSSQNATAFGFRNDLNAIKSNSWGPADNGRITYLSSTERTAIQNAVATGRGGKGTIFCWAAGNGGNGDRVEYDPYASNRYTFPIGAIGDQDTRASYNEKGCSMLVVAHSSGNSRGIYTTTSGSSYTSNFGGTSSASPLAAGAAALALQANPNLTWRDLQHVLINSARKNHSADANWSVNAAGHDINYNYGFGAIDANALTALAASWANVGPEVSFSTGTILVNAAIPDNSTAGLTRTYQVPANIRIESYELVLSATTTYVGDLRIQVTAPSGTKSLLAAVRADPTDNYSSYIFTSRRCWDELSAGTWSINISDRAAGNAATWTNYQLKIYGRNP